MQLNDKFCVLHSPLYSQSLTARFWPFKQLIALGRYFKITLDVWMSLKGAKFKIKKQVLKMYIVVEVGNLTFPINPTMLNWNVG